MSPAGAPTPIVLLPVGSDEGALDACLAALDAGTPPGTRVWLADNAQSGPRGIDLIESWLARTRLQAGYTRRTAPVAEAAHLAEALRACGDSVVAVLSPDARPTPGWLGALADCFRHDPKIATATPWCNAGETAAWPRIGEIETNLPAPAPLAEACARLAARASELPAAVAHAVLLRGSACAAAGGLDAASFHSWPVALIDLSLRLAGLGWRNVLCPSAFVLREVESVPGAGDMDALAARWPNWNARIATFLMDDPLRALREQLHAALAVAPGQSPQLDLFPDAT
ncbi:glycosyltransferase [Thermomonas sp.]|uniref:glycosyltransferase n=1 Tax=Thermomonas sp. TaxID=1971895 RepID=UPI002CE705DC|nr:glycosyltransferase [Thermomonas sp.]HRO62165.1 glycosyltransferase [Thermomonas sp.]